MIQKVLKNGECYQNRDVEILGTKYVVCYAPFYQENTNQPVCMIFLGTPRANVSAIINEIRLQMLIVIAVVLFVTTLFLIRVINGMINGLASGMKVLQKLSEGDLTAEADTAILNRTDEIGMLGKEIICTGKRCRRRYPDHRNQPD